MTASKSCFVISAIGVKGSVERKHADLLLNYIIRPAVGSLGYSVGRADESGHSGMITVDVINSLLDADLVVADLSFLNPNVFYELGLRHSSRRPTIHLASIETRLPFDNADHRAIFYDIADWDSHQQAIKRIEHHVQAIENDSVTNPVTIAQAHRNDARLSRVIDSVSLFLVRLEERISHISDVPPGRITKGRYRLITENHKQEIMSIVKSIRQKVDDKQSEEAQESLPQVKDVLRRLSAIENIVNSKNGVYADPAEQRAPQ